MSIAVERVQNYYQYQDAEAKLYQVILESIIEIFSVRVTENFLLME